MDKLKIYKELKEITNGVDDFYQITSDRMRDLMDVIWYELSEEEMGKLIEGNSPENSGK